MNKLHLTIALLPAVVLTGALLSRGGGILPGSSSSFPTDGARLAPSCTSCHSGTIGSSGVATQMTAPQHSLSLNESIQVALQVSGGPSGSKGGFAAENTAGTFSAGTNTQVNSSGRAGQFITHTGNSSRSWSLPYAAPNTPGLVKLYAVAMASSGSSTGGDSIAFHGYNPAATSATPVYLGINANGNQRFGQGCVGGYGNWPVLYSDLVPNRGSANYAVKVAGAAPSSTALFLIGTPLAAAIDLSVIGVTGCGMWVNSVAQVVTATTAGNAQMAEGTATAGLPLPGAAALQGVTLAVQAAIVDVPTGRGLPLTVTNGLLVTIQ